MAVNYFLILIILLTLSPPFFQLVQADHSLIEEECHNADVADICLRCVESDPGAKTADRIGIAFIVLRCLNKQSSVLLVNTTELASKAKDKKSKQVFESCSNGFSTANQYLSTAAAYLQKDDYDKANLYVTQALQDCNYCHFYSKGLLGATSLVYEMEVYEELSNAAKRIIDRF